MDCRLARIFGCCLPLFFFAGPAVAMTCEANSAAWQKWVSQGEPYSVAICEGSDPRVRFKQAEGRALQVSTAHPQSMLRDVKLDPLAKAAKAALEAGFNEKAGSYAKQALALARRDWCIDSGTMLHRRDIKAAEQLRHPDDANDRAARDFCTTAPGSYSSPQTRGDAITTSNLVLGRLALLRGHVGQAEKFLLASGQIEAGGLQTVQFGPNMVLALELLKRGRTEVVLRFLNEWAQLCHSRERAKLMTWAADIKAGEIPEFGANLLF